MCVLSDSAAAMRMPCVCCQTLQQYRGDSQTETEVLLTRLESMKDKNAHLETSLSAETRLKLDLFSALGDAKRQMEIQQGQLNAPQCFWLGLRREHRFFRCILIS